MEKMLVPVDIIKNEFNQALVYVYIAGAVSIFFVQLFFEVSKASDEKYLGVNVSFFFFFKDIILCVNINFNKSIHKN